MSVRQVQGETVRLVVFGGTGYAGGKIVQEALQRGHQVVAVARNVATLDRGHPRLIARAGSIHDESFVRDVTADADVVIVAVRALPDADGKGLLDALPTLLTAAQAAGARIGIIGGAGSLRVSEGGPRLIDTPEFPEAALPEATAHAKVLEALTSPSQGSAPQDVDWFYVSPAAMFGAHAPGERQGLYRIGGDLLLADDSGQSKIGGDDFATALVDEIDMPTHHRTRFCVAY